MNERDRAIAADTLFQRIRPLFAGYEPEMQGAVLAQLVALWLAGFVSDDAAHEDAARAELLEDLVGTIQQLIPVMYQLHVRPQR
jgi:hypothetical protein